MFLIILHVLMAMNFRWIFNKPCATFRCFYCTFCREIELLRTSREKQKDMVEAIVKQRDMHRILLAQNTPLPSGDDTSQVLNNQWISIFFMFCVVYVTSYTYVHCVHVCRLYTFAVASSQQWFCLHVNHTSETNWSISWIKGTI